MHSVGGVRKHGDAHAGADVEGRCGHAGRKDMRALQHRLAAQPTNENAR